MNNQIHGHDVLDLMTASGESFTRAKLASAMDAKFGPAAHYNTCSVANLTASELIDFFIARGKFQGNESGFSINPERVCQH
ncbi:MAG: YecH family protein [Lacunisphaera sp.]|nr:YecH family protein [Lacunisphaera sp.]